MKGNSSLLVLSIYHSARAFAHCHTSHQRVASSISTVAVAEPQPPSPLSLLWPPPTMISASTTCPPRWLSIAPLWRLPPVTDLLKGATEATRPTVASTTISCPVNALPWVALGSTLPRPNPRWCSIERDTGGVSTVPPEDALSLVGVGVGVAGVAVCVMKLRQ